MDVRCQLAMVFHLDKCVGCHDCSSACKRLFTDRAGAETMWWNHVETRPGAGFPSRWDERRRNRGGFELHGRQIRLRAGGRIRGALEVLLDPERAVEPMPYAPHVRDGSGLLTRAEGGEQPVARTLDPTTGAPCEVRSGPDWDGDLADSPASAACDPLLEGLGGEERRALLEMQRLVYFHLPRMCSHCLNPSCVAACPSGAVYKRGEDGVVLIGQDRCQGWQRCAAACPYKKTHFNHVSGRSEKCLLCYPGLEQGRAPVCFSACAAGVRYLGVVLYDADAIEGAVRAADADLVARGRNLLLDPDDPEVIAASRACGLSEEVLAAARRSPVWQFVGRWGLGLPLHPEYRTLPMLFYVPPLSPMRASMGPRGYQTPIGLPADDEASWRLPIAWLAGLFSAGNPEPVRHALRTQQAVRRWRHARHGDDAARRAARAALAEVGCDQAQADAIAHLTTTTDPRERHVVPRALRAQAAALEGGHLRPPLSGPHMEVHHA